MLRVARFAVTKQPLLRRSLATIAMGQRGAPHVPCVTKLVNHRSDHSRRTFLTTRNLMSGGGDPENGIVQFNLSDIGEGIREVVIREWYVEEGSTVSQFDSICEVQSDKATVTITSRYDGKILKLHHEVDATCLVGTPLVDIELEGGVTKPEDRLSRQIDKSDVSFVSSESTDVPSLPPLGDAPSFASSVPPQPVVSAASSTTQASQRRSTGGTGEVLTTPAVRRLAKMQGIHDLSVLVPGSGPNGRILKEDVLNYTPGAAEKTSAAPSAAPLKSAQPVAVPAPSDRTIVFKGVRKAMIKTMTASLAIPHFTFSDEIRLAGVKEEIASVQIY